MERAFTVEEGSIVEERAILVSALAIAYKNKKTKKRWVYRVRRKKKEKLVFWIHFLFSITPA